MLQDNELTFRILKAVIARKTSLKKRKMDIAEFLFSPLYKCKPLT